MADDREDVYSKAVRAGKRTYFFDVKSTRGRDLFLTITESKKHTHEDGSATFEKHKIFLYKEDFDKFLNGLHEAFDEIDRLRHSNDYARESAADAPAAQAPSAPVPFKSIEFDDLGKDDRTLQE
ncbi:MAG TPA: DUF3276 family protein [Flavobacteriales bacterium]